jgi:hypothetical protein
MLMDCFVEALAMSVVGQVQLLMGRRRQAAMNLMRSTRHPERRNLSDRYIPQLLDELLQHFAVLLRDNQLAMGTVLELVPVPLMRSLLLDKVLLNMAGTFLAHVGPLFTENRHDPVLFFLVALLIDLDQATLLNVW